MKVLHLPTPVGGNAWGLSQAERRLGLESTTLYAEQTWIDYPGDIILNGVDPNRFLLLASSVWAALTIPKKYDVLHFNFGTSLIDFINHGVELWDLPLYRKQKLFVTYNGCDARMKYSRIQQVEINACSHSECYAGMCDSLKVDRRKKKRIEKFEHAGARFFALNPDLMWNLPKGTQFLPYSIAGWDQIDTLPEKQPGRCLKIVHAPTDRACKGSDAVITACSQLQKKYPGRLQLELVEGISYASAIGIYAQADLIVDQLRLGWYGAFAVEAMKMGKPVLAYIEKRDLCFIPPQMRQQLQEAIIEANEYNLEKVLELYINQPELLHEKRLAALEYVYKWHEPIYAGRITKNAYENALET